MEARARRHRSCLTFCYFVFLLQFIANFCQNRRKEIISLLIFCLELVFSLLLVPVCSYCWAGRVKFSQTRRAIHQNSLRLRFIIKSTSSSSSISPSALISSSYLFRACLKLPLSPSALQLWLCWLPTSAPTSFTDHTCSPFGSSPFSPNPASPTNKQLNTTTVTPSPIPEINRIIILASQLQKLARHVR